MIYKLINIIMSGEDMMKVWEERENRRILREKLKMFHERNYRGRNPLTNEVKLFLDKYRIKEFFITLLKSFDPELHISNTTALIQTKVDIWNETNSNEKITIETLESEYFLIRNRTRAVINPFLSRREILSNDKYILLCEIEDLEFFYPLFSRQHFERLLGSHNETFQIELTADSLLGTETSLYGSIFHDFYGQKSAFNEALIIYFCSVSFNDLEQNIDRYGQLLLELHKAQIDLGPCMKNMDHNKELLIANYLIHQLKKSEILAIDDLNYINRLRYIQYQIQGIDVTNPPKESRVIAYRNNYYNSNDFVGQLHSIEHLYHDFERSANKLVPEVSFSLYYLNKNITPEIWGQILDSCNSLYYKYEIFLHLNFIPVSSAIIDFKSLHIAPLVLMLLSGMRRPRMIEDLVRIGYTTADEELFDLYINELDDNSVTYKDVLLECYLRLPTGEELFGQAVTAKKQRKSIIKKLLEVVKRPGQEFSPSDLAKFRARRVKEDFAIFDLLIQAGGYLDFILEEYKNLLQDQIYQTYYFLNGKENLFIVFNQLNCHQFESLFINPQEYLVGTETEVFSKGRNLRFHLGVLSLFLLNNKTNINYNIVEQYVLTAFQNAKGMKIGSTKVFSWLDISFDTFNIHKDSYDKNSFLTYCISKLLMSQNDNYKKSYFTSIRWNLSLVEAILLKQEAKIDNIIIEDFLGEDIFDGAGHLQKDTLLLIRAGYPEQGLSLIENIKKRRKIYDDIVKSLEFEALVSLKCFDRARILLEQFQDKRRNLSKEGLLLYFEDQYSQAETAFKTFFAQQSSVISVFDVVNYSAVLIKQEKFLEARNLLESYQHQYDNDPILFLNLGIAYVEIDKFKSMFYLSMAQKLAPKDKNITVSLLTNLKELIPTFDQFFENDELNPDFNDLGKEYLEVMQQSLMKIKTVQISELEATIVREIYLAIESIQNNPTRLSGQSETELSDDITNIIGAVLRREGIVVEREHPGGRAIEHIGEIDLFIYRQQNQEILAVGENKHWSPENFKKQIKQLIGYMQPDRGFGFSIIFNKNTQLRTVLEGRTEILKNFFVEKDGSKYFETKDPILYAEHWIPGIKDVLITYHENPEKPQSILRIYHFIVNCKNDERMEAARQARI